MKLTMKLLALLFGVLMLGNVAYAQSPREQLKQMVEQLQQSPNDNALREKIITLAQGLKPAPKIPEEARRYLARGIAAFETAKNAEDFKLALPEFQNAANVAPWWPDTYFNLAKAQEKNGDLKGAIASYRLYLVADPNAKDAEIIRTQSYKLEFMAEQKTKIDEAKAKESEAKLQRQRWASDLVKWLQANYGGRYGKHSGCGTHNGLGCEQGGSNWWEIEVLNRRFAYRVFGKDNDQIQLTEAAWNGLFCGVLIGADIKDVKWSYCGDSNLNKEPLDTRIEFTRSRDNKHRIRITRGCDGGQFCRYDDIVLEE